MAGMRRGVGPAVAPRPVLELIKEPMYDTLGIANGASASLFFSNPIGSADATALTGTKTESETNMIRQNAMPTPQMLDVYAISCKYQSAIAFADLQAFLNVGSLRFHIGTKDYLFVKLSKIPSDVAIWAESDAAAAAVLAATNGVQLHANVFDLTIPEEMLDANTGRVFLTGRRVPIHIPSEQNFFVELNFPGTITLTATTRVTVVLWSVRKREVM